MHYLGGEAVPRRILGFVAVPVLVFASACGSTVSLGQTSAGQPLTDGLSSTTADNSSGSLSQSIQQQGTSSGAPGLTSSTSTAPSSTAFTGEQPTGGSGVSGGARDAVGVSPTSVTIGISNVSNADAANAALGANFTAGNTKGEMDAMVSYINAHGGVGGKKLIVVFHPVDGASSQTRDQRDQAACADYTQDHHVFAVLDSTPSENLLSCIGKTAINIAGFETSGYNKVDFIRHPYFFDINTLVGESEYGDLVPLLVRQGWVSGWNNAAGAAAPAVKAVLGVLSVDYPQITTVTDHVLLPALARAGYAVKPENVVRLHNPNSQAETSQTVAQIQSSVLRFRSAGVTHVIIMDSAGGVTFFFGTDAESQGYRPRYGVTSANAMQGLLESGQLPKRQAAGAMGLGYVPLGDIPAADDPPNSGPYTNATRRLCLSIFSKAGIKLASPNEQQIALLYCDKFLFFQHAASSVRGALTRDSFRASVDALGTSFAPSTLQGGRFDATHHFANYLGYDLRYVPACGCMRYFGSPFRLSAA